MHQTQIPSLFAICLQTIAKNINTNSCSLQGLPEEAAIELLGLVLHHQRLSPPVVELFRATGHEQVLLLLQVILAWPGWPAWPGGSNRDFHPQSLCFRVFFAGWSARLSTFKSLRHSSKIRPTSGLGTLAGSELPTHHRKGPQGDCRASAGQQRQPNLAEACQGSPFPCMARRVACF